MRSIRPATAHDAAAIAHVHVESWRSTYAGIVPAPFLEGLDEADRTRQWTEWLQLEIPAYVAEVNGNLVGFASGGPIREPIPGVDAELFAIYLLEPMQHRGIGTALLRTLARALTERGLTSMIAWVLERNDSRYFYERAGAHAIERKQIEIGGASLSARAYAWPSLTDVAGGRQKLP